jgi:flagellar M-ring protein FliF
MVDGLSEAGPDGRPEWRPRPPEELETLRTLVQSAVGFDAERGDTVTIETLQFTALPEAGVLAERSAGDWLAGQAARLAQIGVLGAIVLALILFVVRPMLSRRPAPAYAELTGPRALAGDGATEADGSTQRLGSGGGDVLDLPPASMTKVDRLREVIASRSDDSAAVLRAWIESPEARKEPAQT